MTSSTTSTYDPYRPSIKVYRNDIFGLSMCEYSIPIESMMKLQTSCGTSGSILGYIPTIQYNDAKEI